MTVSRRGRSRGRRERAALSHCTARRRRPFPAPKVDMLGSGGCSGWSPILVHISFDGAANERPQFTPLPRTTPSAEPPNWLAFCGAASCRPRAAGRRQASPSRAAQRLPRTQLVRGDALARTTAARVRDARTSSRFSERYRPRGENSRPRARDGWNAGRNFLASDAFWCRRRPSTTPERE